MASDFSDIFKQVKKNNGQAQFAEVQRKREISEEMKELGLTEDEYTEFLKKRDSYKPTLYDATLMLDDVITGEISNRLALFTSWILSQNCHFIEGPSSSGKTAIMDAVIGLVMPSEVLRIDNASDKAIYDQRREIERATYIIMNEVNKINANMFEILKDWSEKKSSLYARAGGLGSNLEKIELPYRCFSFSKADESATVEVPQELIYRLVEITVDSSQEQTKKVLSRKAQNIEDPFSIKHVNTLERSLMRYHISTMPKNLIYVNPMGQKLIETIPTVFTSSRRDFDKYVNNINGIAKYYYKARMQVMIDGKEVQFITPADLALNQIVFGDILVKSSLHCSDLDKIILQVIKNGGSLDKKQIQINLRKCSINTTVKNINKRLDELVDVGYLESEKDNTKIFYSVSNFYKEFVINPDFRAIVDYAKQQMRENEKFKPYAEEYIKNYCEDDKLNIIDPFTGLVINILTYDYSSQLEIEMDDTRLKTVRDESIKLNDMSLNQWF